MKVDISPIDGKVTFDTLNGGDTFILHDYHMVKTNCRRYGLRLTDGDLFPLPSSTLVVPVPLKAVADDGRGPRGPALMAALREIVNRLPTGDILSALNIPAIRNIAENAIKEATR